MKTTGSRLLFGLQWYQHFNFWFNDPIYQFTIAFLFIVGRQLIGPTSRPSIIQNCKQSLVTKFNVFILDNNFSGIVYCILRFYSYCLVCRKYPVKKSILQQLVFYSTASWVEGCGLRWSFPSLELSQNMLPMVRILNTYCYLPYFWYKNKSAQSAFPINFLLPPAYFTLQDDEM